MSVEAFVTKRTGSTSLKMQERKKLKPWQRTNNHHHHQTHLLKVLAVFFAECWFVFCYELLFFFGIVDPKTARTNKVWTCSTFGAGADNFVVELFRLSPRSDTFEAEAMIAIWKDPETLFSSIFLPNDVETDATSFLFWSLNRERELHFFLVDCDAFGVVFLSLFTVKWIEAEFTAQFTQFAMRITAMIVTTKSTFHEKWAESRRVVDKHKDSLLVVFLVTIWIHNISVWFGRIVGIEFFLWCRHENGSFRV